MINQCMILVIPILIRSAYTKAMKTLFVLTLLVASWFVQGGEPISACTSCHSKNPKMVRMHEELGFKDCFKCHGQGMGKTPEERKAQMTGDERCIPCHKK
jgi:hypothetical protein